MKTQQEPNKETVNKIIEEVSQATGVGVSEILSNRRFETLVRARHLALYVCSKKGFSHSEISAATGFSKASVSHAIVTVEARFINKPHNKVFAEDIIDRLKIPHF